MSDFKTKCWWSKEKLHNFFLKSCDIKFKTKPWFNRKKLTFTTKTGLEADFDERTSSDKNCQFLVVKSFSNIS